MRTSLTVPDQQPETASAPERSFRFTVPHAQETTPAPVSGREHAAPGWQGITAGWLAASESVA